MSWLRQKGHDWGAVLQVWPACFWLSLGLVHVVLQLFQVLPQVVYLCL